MKKIICSISFYLAATFNLMMICSNNLGYICLGLVWMVILLCICKMVGREAMYEIAGINWLQKTFKNNVVIMDMTNE